jgi:hypothetical protein
MRRSNRRIKPIPKLFSRIEKSARSVGAHRGLLPRAVSPFLRAEVLGRRVPRLRVPDHPQPCFRQAQPSTPVVLVGGSLRHPQAFVGVVPKFVELIHGPHLQPVNVGERTSRLT